jgi:hypothetical protein
VESNVGLYLNKYKFFVGSWAQSRHITSKDIGNRGVGAESAKPFYIHGYLRPFSR